MSLMDTREAQLAAYEHPRSPSNDDVYIRQAVAVARQAMAAAEQKRGERFNPERQAEEIETTRREAVVNWQTGLQHADDALDAGSAQAVAAWDAAARARATDRRQLRDVIDVQTLRESENPDEIVRLVADAEALGGPTVADEAKTIGIHRLRQLMADDLYRGKRLSSPAEVPLNRMMATRRPADRTAIAKSFEQRKQRLHDVVKEIAGVVGLGDALEAAMRRTAVPLSQTPADESTFKVGPFWDRFPGLVRRS